VTRLLLQGPDNALRATELFHPGELADVADTFAAVNATSDLLGRQRVREHFEKVVSAAEGKLQFSERRGYRFDEAGTPPLMQPARALDYFRKLTPTIGVDPQRWGERMQRHAFTLAVDTEGVVLGKVQSVIEQRIATGLGVGTAPAEIDAIMDAAGLTVKNPQYAEMVFRTNSRDAYLTAADEERSDPDVQDYFPAWRYSAVVDSRSRPEHAARNGNYYPASVPFTVVRGTDIGDIANCRCDFIMIDKFEWRDLEAKGASFAAA
jgi:hypothetical protein